MTDPVFEGIYAVSARCNNKPGEGELAFATVTAKVDPAMGKHVTIKSRSGDQIHVCGMDALGALIATLIQAHTALNKLPK